MWWLLCDLFLWFGLVGFWNCVYDGFGFEEFFEVVVVLFVVVVWLFVVVEWSFKVGLSVVDVYVVGVDLCGDVFGVFEIVWLYVVGEVVWCVVGYFDGFFFCFVWEDGEDWFEDFFVCDCYVVVDVVEDGWFDEIVCFEIFWFVGVVGDEFGVFFDVFFDEVLDFVVL